MPDSFRIFVGPSRLIVDIDGHPQSLPLPTTPGRPKGEIDIPPSQFSSYKRTVNPKYGYGIRYDSAGIEKDSVMVMQKPDSRPDIDEENIPESVPALDDPKATVAEIPGLDYTDIQDDKEGEGDL